MAVNVNVIRRRIDNDYSSTKSVYISGGGSGATFRRELGRLFGGTDIVDKIVEVPFGVEFDTKPIGWFDCYRMRQRNGDWVKSQVLTRHATEDWLTTTGFELIIDESESLTGLILEYYYTE